MGRVIFGGTYNNVLADSNTELSQEENAVVEEYKENLNNLDLQYRESLKIKDSYLYINASEKAKNDFDLNLKANNDLLNQLDANYDDDINYIDVNKEIKNRIEFLDDSIAKLDGKPVDTDELVKILDEAREFKRNSEYKKAPAELKNKFDEAIDNGYKIYSLGDSIDKESYDNAIIKINDSKNAILTYTNTVDAQKNLADKIKDAEKIISEGKDKYTENSLTNLKQALENAKLIAENKQAQLSRLEEGIKKLDEAINNLVTIESQETIDELINKLELAKKDNKIAADAARMLINEYPATVKNIKSELEKLIEDSEKLVKQADEILDKYEK